MRKVSACSFGKENIIWRDKETIEKYPNGVNMKEWKKKKTFGPILKSYFELKEGILGSHSHYNLSSHMKPEFLDSSHLKQY